MVLRRHVSRAWPWVVASALAWCGGLLVFAGITTPLWREGQSPVLVALICALGGLAMAATMAWVTGAFLAKIVTARPAQSGPPRGVAEQDWEELVSPTDRHAVFDPNVLEDLPGPVRRWLWHAIDPGTPFLTAAEVEMSGSILVGRTWRSFRSRQRVSLSKGFVWSTRTRLGALPVSGFDRYTHGSGEMSWRLLGRIPLMSAMDDAVTRSAAGRHVAEALAALPAAALDPSATWEAIDDVRAAAHLPVGGEVQKVTVTVGPTGQLRQLEMDRWGTPPGGAFGCYSFGAVFDAEGYFGGYRIPTLVTAGWHFGADQCSGGRFIRYEITRVRFT